MTTQSLLLPVLGEFETLPEIRVQPTVQRASPTAAVGWRYRRRYTLTNGGSEPVQFFPYLISLGDTTPLTTTKAQADGDDVRVWLGGREVARTLKSWDTAASGVWVVIPYLDAGESITYDVVYGNASAVTPPALTAGTDLPAFDPATSSNAAWKYLVNDVAANAGKGGWDLTATTGQPDPRFGVPGAWKLVNTLPTDDDRRQEAYSDYTDTNDYVQAIFDATRARRGTMLLGLNNGADGVALRVPVGIESVTAGLRWQNLAQGDTVTTPVGQVVILTRNNPHEQWKTLYSNNALQATEAAIASATYTPDATVKELAFAVWPYEGTNISLGAKPDRFVAAKWDTTLEVNLDDSIITQSGGTEVEVYELATTLRSQGGGDSAGVPPYKAVYLGNAASADGVDTPRLAVALNQIVRIFTETRRAEVWDSALAAKVEDVPTFALNAVDGLLDIDGETVEQRSADWMPLQPMVNPLSNPSAATDATGWEKPFTTANLTAGAITRTTAQFDSSPASLTLQVTANTSGVGGIVEAAATDYLPVGNRESVQVGVAIRTSNTNLQPTPTIWFFDDDQNWLDSNYQADWTIPAADTWYRRLFAAAVPEGAAYYRVGVTGKSKTSNQTGTIFWDTVEVNDTEIALSDVSKGTLVLSAAWKDRYAYA